MEEIEKLDDVEERYEVPQPPIGAGGQGVLFAGWERDSGRKVALKVQRPWELESESSFGALGDELAEEGIRTGRLAKVPAVPQVFATGWFRNRRCIVLEFVEGAVLYDVLFKRRPVRDAASVASVIGQLCEVLHAVHEERLVHCDVKPENVIVEPSGRLRLVDMGHAITMGERTGMSRGTIGYVPPEQLDENPKGLSGQADIFALGCMLLEMTVMRLPYEGTHGRPLPESPVLPPGRLAAIPPEFRSLALRMVEREANRRPADVREVFDSLRPHLPTLGSRRPGKPLNPDPTEHYRTHPPSL